MYIKRNGINGGETLTRDEVRIDKKSVNNFEERK